MRDWDLSTLIPIYKNKGLVVEPANHRPLRLILIVRKTFEMGTVARLVVEKPDEREQQEWRTVEIFIFRPRTD